MKLMLKEARVKAGITQSELARKSGITRQTIIKLEEDAGTATTTLKTLKALANALNTSVTNLFCE